MGKISILVASLLISCGAMAANKVDTLPGGISVEHLVVGTGATPKASQTVKVHYKGTLVDGKEFDSSYKRGQPIEFPLGDVIPCWTQGVQKIAVGGKAKLTCPGSVAYGPGGIPGVIPPNATLNFEIELLGIK